MDGTAFDQSLYHVDDDLMINFMVGGIFSACTAERREKSACERAKNHRRRRRPSFIHIAPFDGTHMEGKPNF